MPRFFILKLKKASSSVRYGANMVNGLRIRLWFCLSTTWIKSQNKTQIDVKERVSNLIDGHLLKLVETVAVHATRCLFNRCQQHLSTKRQISS